MIFKNEPVLSYIFILFTFVCLFSYSKSINAQTIVSCDIEQSSCSIEVTYNWQHVTTRACHKPEGEVCTQEELVSFDHTTELSTYQIEPSSGDVITFREDDAACSEPCYAASSNNLIVTIDLSIPRNEVLDDGKTLFDSRIRSIDNEGRVAEWGYRMEADLTTRSAPIELIFPADFIASLHTSPSSVVNFTIIIL